jgi:hypothetical protein
MAESAHFAVRPRVLALPHNPMSLLFGLDCAISISDG